MFEIRVSDAKTLRDAMIAISTLIDEGTFEVDSEGISLRSMDPSRVAMVDFRMNKNIFEEYAIEGNMKLCLSLSELLKLLKRAGRDEVVELFVDTVSTSLTVTISGKYTRTFKMPILEATEEKTPTPKVTFNTKAVLTTDGLRQSLEDVSLVGDHVRMEADNTALRFSGKGDIMGADIELKKDSDSLLSLEVKEPSRSTFPLSYLSEIVKAASVSSDIVSLEFASDMPLRLDFKQTYDGILIYYLAPRIEVE